MNKCEMYIYRPIEDYKCQMCGKRLKGGNIVYTTTCTAYYSCSPACMKGYAQIKGYEITNLNDFETSEKETDMAGKKKIYSTVIVERDEDGELAKLPAQQRTRLIVAESKNKAILARTIIEGKDVEVLAELKSYVGMD